MLSTSRQEKISTILLLVSSAVAGGLAHASHYDAGERDVRGARQLAHFAAELNRWSESDASTPKSIEAMIGSTPLAVVGELVAVKPGRKRFLGIGCDNADERSGQCNGQPNAVIYSSYANIVVKPSSILRGSLAVANAPVTVEIGWPNNLGVDALRRTFPRGSRVIVLAEPVRGAEAAAAPLVERGLAREADVVANLVDVPPYGFIVESAEGVVAPMWGEASLVEGETAEVFASFDAAVAALEAAAPHAVKKPLPPGQLPERISGTTRADVRDP